MTDRPRPFRLVQSVTPDVLNALRSPSTTREAQISVWKSSPELRDQSDEVRGSRGPETITIGVWDISARMPYLYDLVETLNVKKEYLLFFEVVASPPLGIEANAKRIEELARSLGKRVSPEDLAGIRRNIVSDDVLPRVRRLRERFALDQAVGIVRQPILIDSSKAIDWDFYADAEEHEALVSTDGVREYAAQAGRSFEASVGYLILGIVACAIQDDVDYHKENRGCLFDYNESRETLVHSLKMFRLCEQCTEIDWIPQLKVLGQILDHLKTFSPRS
jgi:hypothetical protein